MIVQKTTLIFTTGILSIHITLSFVSVSLKLLIIPSVRTKWSMDLKVSRYY